LLRIIEINYEDWSKIWRDCEKSTLLQSWEYGTVKENVENWRPHRFVILDNMGENVGLIQVLVKKIPLIGYFARVNRGPIITSKVNNTDKKETIIESIKLLAIESKNRKWRTLQIAPELDHSINSINALKTIGFNHLSRVPWASGVIPLQMNKEDLLMQLNGKWRNCLRKGLKSNISITYSDNCTQDLNLLFENYSTLIKEKQFSGISKSFIQELALQNNKNWKFNLFVAFNNSEQKKETIGTLVSISHGDTTIYLIGTSNSIGRKLNVNYVLLWEAIIQSKNQGCNWFDIGGLNKDTPPGIAHFKMGINSHLYQLIGELRLINLFFKH